jgi:hypothetical protein
VFVEALATWIEDEVFDSVNDNYNYLWPDLTTPMGRYRKSPYPYWVVFRAMAERFGTGVKNGSEKVVQTFWEQISKRASTNLTALAKGFKAKNTTLVNAYHDASIALRFSVDCDTTDPRYCLEEGPAYPLGGFDPHPGDHATLVGPTESLVRKVANDLALNWIGLPTTANIDLTVTHDGGKGVLKVSIACRAGTTVTVTPVGTATTTADAQILGANLNGCDDATAVISNVKVTSATPKKITRTDYTISVA